jgi:hypothetical protein
MGLLAGSAIGAGSGQDSGYDSQRRYDHAYIQCMYAKGDRVPVSGQLTQGSARSYNPPPPPSSSYTPPPPPPGYAPPPPPGVAR